MNDTAESIVLPVSDLDLAVKHALLPAWPAVLCLCQYPKCDVLQGSTDIKELINQVYRLA